MPPKIQEQHQVKGRGIPLTPGQPPCRRRRATRRPRRARTSWVTLSGPTDRDRSMPGNAAPPPRSAIQESMAHGDGRGVGRGGVVVMHRRGAALNRWKRRGLVGAPGIYAHNSRRSCVRSCCHPGGGWTRTREGVGDEYFCK
jgi:hypothetical protein